MRNRSSRNTGPMPTCSKSLRFQGVPRTVLAATFAVVTTVVLCLLFPETRWMGVLGAAVMAYLHPLFLLVVTSVAGVAAAFIYHVRRRSFDEQAEPDPRGD